MFAEQRVAATVRYRQEPTSAQTSLVNERKAALDQAKRAVDIARAQGDPAQLSLALQHLGIAQSNYSAVAQTAAPRTYRPIDVTCVGRGRPYGGGWKYADFKCFVEFEVAWGSISVHVTGPRSFTWKHLRAPPRG